MKTEFRLMSNKPEYSAEGFQDVTLDLRGVVVYQDSFAGRNTYQNG